MRLYEIEARMDLLLDRYNEAETDEQREEIQKHLEALELTRDQKFDACCKWYQNLMAEADTISAEIERLHALQTSAIKRAESFKEYLGRCLGVGETWKNSLFNLRWLKREAVKITDEAAIPVQYQREILKYEPDKKQILADLKCGATIPGTELEVRNYLQIK